MSCLLCELPFELIDLICQFMTLKEMSTLSLTNKYILELIRTNSFYSFCKESFISDEIEYICALMNHFNFFKRFCTLYPSKCYASCIFWKACVAGEPEATKFLNTHHKLDFIEDMFIATCRDEYLEIAQFLYETYPKF